MKDLSRIIAEAVAGRSPAAKREAVAEILRDFHQIEREPQWTHAASVLEGGPAGRHWIDDRRAVAQVVAEVTADPSLSTSAISTREAKAMLPTSASSRQIRTCAERIRRKVHKQLDRQKR